MSEEVLPVLRGRAGAINVSGTPASLGPLDRAKPESQAPDPQLLPTPASSRRAQRLHALFDDFRLWNIHVGGHGGIDER